jgi:threonine aldolase
LATPIAAGLAQGAVVPAESRVLGTGDGIALSPANYAELLRTLSSGVKADFFSLGGVVGELEERMAAELGKEAAVWMPTGTLANHMAMRLLAGDKRRVVVQGESHLFNDCGDCCQTLSGLHMLPLAMGRATYTVEELEEWMARGAGGRVNVPIGALQIETPVRRRTGEMFEWGQMQRVTAWAREKGIGTHLDGARLYIGAAYGGHTVKEYAAMFDTVYVSMYKYFNGASGAVLAGPRKLLTDLFHARRMFGGGQHEAWPFAAVAMHFQKGFVERLGRAVANSETVIAGLRAEKRFVVERVPNGSNLFYLKVPGVDTAAFAKRVSEAGVGLGAAQGDRFTVAVNETWNRAPAGEIVSRLRSGLA